MGWEENIANKEEVKEFKILNWQERLDKWIKVAGIILKNKPSVVRTHETIFEWQNSRFMIYDMIDSQ